MKNIISIALLGFALCLPSMAALNTILQTSLSSAITDTATCFNVASATGIQGPNFNTGTAGSALFVADIGGGVGELMNVTSVTSTRVCVVRSGRVSAHGSGAMVLVATAANWFYGSNPPAGKIRSTCAQEYVAPWINAQTGQQWLCSDKTLSYTGGWGNASGGGGGQAEVLSATATASVAGATAIAGPYLEISGTNAITSFTMSVGWNGQGFCVYPTAAFTITATNNIAKAATAVADRTLCFSYNANSAKFAPSY